MSTSRLYAIVEAHEAKWGVKPSEVARRMGVTPQTISKWRRPGRELPKSENLEALARVTGRPYIEVLTAALADAAYVADPAAADRDLRIQLAEPSPVRSADSVDVSIAGQHMQLKVHRVDGQPTTAADIVAGAERMTPEVVLKAMLDVLVTMDEAQLAAALAGEDELTRKSLTGIYRLLRHDQKQAQREAGSARGEPVAAGSTMRGSA